VMLKYLLSGSFLIIVISLCYSKYFSSKPPKCTLDMFNVNTTIMDDTWNKIKDGEVQIDLFDKNYGHRVGYINYRKYIGQIGLLFIIDDKYINRGLGTQLVNIAIEDMKTVRTEEVWAVTSNMYFNFFYKKIELFSY
jgi:RimJ/RimL family protein N-acetyltransferase